MEEWRNEIESLRRLRPRHILFLCVGNSERSQIAEGIARALAPAGVAVSSAGSQPETLNPLAVAAMTEIGIDISHHYSKGLDAIDLTAVEAVITLCAEENCPIFPGQVLRLHWGMPDPARERHDRTKHLAILRRTRAELMTRLKFLFEGWNIQGEKHE